MVRQGNWSVGHQGFIEVRRGGNSQVSLEAAALPKTPPRRIRSMLEEGIDPAEYTRSRMAEKVAAGEVPPQLAGSDPRTVVVGLAAQHGWSDAQEERFANSLGLFVERPAAEVQPGDWVDLEPVMRTWANPSDPATAGQLAVAGRQLVHVDGVERNSRTSVVLVTELGEWVVPDNTPLGLVMSSSQRCPECASPDPSTCSCPSVA